MPTTLRYDATAANQLLEENRLEEIEPSLTAARDETLQDVDLLRSGSEIPEEKQPLDAGFLDLPQRLLAEDAQNESLLKQIDKVAERLRGEVDRVVLLGIGGSYMGARALFEALCNPFHNELNRDERDETPRLYFEGNNLDNGSVHSLLDLLQQRCQDTTDVNQRWSTIVISKSGGTLETAVAFRLFRNALEDYYGPGSDESRRYVVPITGEAGKLRDFSNERQYPDIFPIPDNVGGRFSIFTSVGLMPAAVLGLDIRKLLQGAADMTETFRRESLGQNPVLDYVATCHLFEREYGITIRVLSTWGKRLEALGLWYDQLLAESLGKEERGATPITVVNTRDLHSRGQQHQEGVRDKLITNLMVEESATEPVPVPTVPDDENQDQLNKLQGKTFPDLLSAAFEGTNQAYAEACRPTADIFLPRLDEYNLGQLLQMLMLATVVEGRLIGVNPYGQPGVEAYKKNMTDILSRN